MTNNMDELNDKFKRSAENFSLIPSSGIWRKVEADIRKRERRKKFFIFFFIGAAILTGGIFLFNYHSTTVSRQTGLQKNNPTVREHKRTQQNISTEENNSTKENSSVPQAFSENKNPNGKNEVALRKNHSANSGSPSALKSVSTSIPRAISNQNNLAAGNPIQPEITTSITPVISSVVADSIKSDSPFANAKDTLQPEIKKDHLPATKPDTINKDSLIATDTVKTIPNQTKWSLAVCVAPTLSFTQQNEQGDNQIISNYRDSSDKTLLRWNYHFAINYKVIPEVEVFTGIGIINLEQGILSHQAVMKYDTIWGTTFPSPPVNIVKGYFNINGDSTGTVKNKFSYLEIPVGIRYDLLPDHKFNISLQPEISFNKLISSDGYIYNYQNLTYEKIKSYDLKTWLISYGVGLSFQYAVWKNLHFEFTPYYKSFQKSVYSDAYPVSQRFQQAEFRLSLRYLIK